MRSETPVVLRKAVLVMCQLHFILGKFKVQEGSRSALGQTPGWFFQWLDHWRRICSLEGLISRPPRGEPSQNAIWNLKTNFQIIATSLLVSGLPFCTHPWENGFPYWNLPPQAPVGSFFVHTYIMISWTAQGLERCIISTTQKQKCKFPRFAQKAGKIDQSFTKYALWFGSHLISNQQPAGESDIRRQGGVELQCGVPRRSNCAGREQGIPSPVQIRSPPLLSITFYQLDQIFKCFCFSFCVMSHQAREQRWGQVGFILQHVQLRHCSLSKPQQPRQVFLSFPAGVACAGWGLKK